MAEPLLKRLKSDSYDIKKRDVDLSEELQVRDAGVGKFFAGCLPQYLLSDVFIEVIAIPASAETRLEMNGIHFSRDTIDFPMASWTSFTNDTGIAVSEHIPIYPRLKLYNVCDET